MSDTSLLSGSVNPNDLKTNIIKKNGRSKILRTVTLVGATITVGAILFIIIRRRRSNNQLPLESSIPIQFLNEEPDAEELHDINEEAQSATTTTSTSTMTTTTTTTHNNEYGVPQPSQGASNQRHQYNLIDTMKNYVIKVLNEHDKDKNWNAVFKHSTNTLDYILKKRQPTNDEPEYISITTYKNFSNIEKIKAYMMDNEYKLKHDNAFKSATRLEVDESNKIEVWHIMKEYPIVGEREYILASRLWEEPDGSFVCISKVVHHPNSSSIKKERLVEKYFSAWQVSRVNDSKDCQFKLYHKEDFKSKIAKGVMSLLPLETKVWQYVLQTERLIKNYVGSNS